MITEKIIAEIRKNAIEDKEINPEYNVVHVDIIDKDAGFVYIYFGDDTTIEVCEDEVIINPRWNNNEKRTGYKFIIFS